MAKKETWLKSEGMEEEEEMLSGRTLRGEYILKIESGIERPQLFNANYNKSDYQKPSDLENVLRFVLI